MSGQDAKFLHRALRIYASRAQVLAQLIVVQLQHLPGRTSNLHIASTEHLQIYIHSPKKSAVLPSSFLGTVHGAECFTHSVVSVALLKS